MDENSKANVAESRGYWRGRPLESLSKEELIKVIEGMDRTIKSLMAEHAKDLDFLLGPVGG